MRREWQERFPCHRLHRKPLVSNPGMHHGTCITHRRMRNQQFCVSGKTPILPTHLWQYVQYYLVWWAVAQLEPIHSNHIQFYVHPTNMWLTVSLILTPTLQTYRCDLCKANRARHGECFKPNSNITFCCVGLCKQWVCIHKARRHFIITRNLGRREIGRWNRLSNIF